MKRTKSLFEKITCYENIRLAWLKARRGKTSKKSVAAFARNAGENLCIIQKNLRASPPVLSPYAQFKIFDPKERVISVVPFSDRVMHHAIMNILEPVFERQFVFHTYACRKGTHAAARYALKKAKSCRCFLKLDVKKYFDSIDHFVLKKLLCRIIKDAHCLSLLFGIIDSYSSGADGKGLPIGNLTSQFFANFYLSALDHFVLEQLKTKGYVRYMDDTVIFEDFAARLKEIFRAVDDFFKRELLLALKPPVSAPCRNGVPFLGWRITPSGITVLKKTRRRMKRKLSAIESDLRSGLITAQKADGRRNAVYASRRV